MNSVILIGRLTADPELRYTPGNQTAVAHFTLAVDRPPRQGEERQADFIRITVFGRQAETCERYLAKGRQVAVNGRIQTGSYKNKEGQTVYTTDVIANRVEFIGSGQGAQGGQRSEANFGNAAFEDNFGGAPDMDLPDSFTAAEDDIPF
jgi:single-strand DNA-binding protein